MLLLHPHLDKERDVAQLVAHASGGREVASSSLVIPTQKGAAEQSVAPFCDYFGCVHRRGQAGTTFLVCIIHGITLLGFRKAVHQCMRIDNDAGVVPLLPIRRASTALRCCRLEAAVGIPMNNTGYGIL